MVAYDAAIVGAGGEGLAAAIALSRAGLKTVVVERNSSVGGRLAAQEFHPGFRANPYADAIAPIPATLFHELGLARLGVATAPQATSLALWPDGNHSLIGRGAGEAAQALFAEAAATRAEIAARAEDEARTPPRHGFFARFARKPFRPWPGAGLAETSLFDRIAAALGDGPLAAHALARAASGCGFDPYLAGSALQLLAAETALVLPGGPASLAVALERAAHAAGVEFSFGVEVSEIRLAKERATALALADGREIAARAVLSTPDLKQTFLSFFAWNGLAGAVRSYRMGPSLARLLIALEAPPDLPAFAREAALFVAPSAQSLAAAYHAAREGVIAPDLPLSLALPGAHDPSCAPPGQAVLTATASAVPFRLFDGSWSHARREALTAQILAQIEAVLPGLRILATSLIAPPDIEAGLAASEGDLCGGEIAPDQMGAFRPWLDGPAAPRTPIAGLYLAGGSTASGIGATGLSGSLAAAALLADLKAGRLT